MSGILSLVGMALIMLGGPLTFVLVIATSSMTVFYLFGGGILALTFIVSTLAITLASYVRLASPWAIVGLVNGILSIFACLGFGTLVFFIG